MGLEGERSFLNVCLRGESGREDIISIQLRRERGGWRIKDEKGRWLGGVNKSNSRAKL